MNVLLSALILICYSVYNCYSEAFPPSQQAEQLLITSLLNGYNKNIRPDSQVNVFITATILQIIAIDEKQQIMTSSSYISQSWGDDRLSWTPNSTFADIEVVMLPVKSIWIPDTMILNSADTNGYLTISDYSLASVYYTGDVYMMLPALTIRTRCNLMVQKFPFDKQTCNINLTSWSQGNNRISYRENGTDVVDISKYLEHPLWQLNSVDLVVVKAEDRVPFEDTYCAEISIQLHIQRKPLFYIMNGIFACLILNCVTLVSYLLPFVSQIALCMTCFMTYSVYSLNFSSLFPQQSEYLMMITLYFLLSISWTLISMVWFVICNYYSTKGEMPKPLQKFSVCLQRIFFCCFPRIKDDKKVDTNIQTGDNKRLGDKTSQSTPAAQGLPWISSQEIIRPCSRRKIGTIHIEQKHVSIEEPPKVASDSKITALTSIVAPAHTSDRVAKENENCRFCRRCESCQADKETEKVKAKAKKEIETKWNALSYFVLICVTLLVLVSNIIVWMLMGQ